MLENQTYTEAIKKNYSSLSKSERRIADYVLSKEYEVSTLTLSELAERTSASDPSVVRFTKAIGFSGYSDFKSQILRDWGRESSTNSSQIQKFVDLNISPDDNIEDLPQKVVNASIKGLEDTMKIFDYAAYDQAIKTIIGANRIDIFGVGTSGSIALDFVSKLIRIGMDARFFSDNHLEQLSCLSLDENDVAIAISHSGSTIDAVDTLRIAKEAGAKTIALTNYKASHIAKYSDINLLTGDHETTFYSETMISRMSLLSLVDMLYTGILLSDYEKYTSILHKVNTMVETKNY